MTERREGLGRLAWQIRSGGGSHLEEARLYIDRMRGRPGGEAVPKLIELLGDESWYLRERATEALAGFGIEAVPMVEEQLTSGLWYTRAAAMNALGQIAAPRSLCLIMDFLEDENHTITEAVARAILDYCRRDRALAVAKILHGRGSTIREKALRMLTRLDPDGGARLRRLVEASDFMGPEGSLESSDERRLAEAVSDECWGINWDRLVGENPLPEPPENLIRYLRGSVIP